MVTPRRAKAIRGGLSQARRDFELLTGLSGTRKGIMEDYKAIPVPTRVQRVDIVLSGIVYLGAVLPIFIFFPLPFTAHGAAYRRVFIPAATRWMEENG